MAFIEIRFITSSAFISKAIRDVTWGRFSHVEFDLEDGTYLGAHSDGGVQIRPHDYCKPSNEERYRIFASDEQKRDTLAYAHSQVGKPYDFEAIAGILFHHDWRDDAKWICSELVTASFEKGGFPLLNAPFDETNRISPRDVYLSPYLIGNRLYPIS